MLFEPSSPTAARHIGPAGLAAKPPPLTPYRGAVSGGTSPGAASPQAGAAAAAVAAGAIAAAGSAAVGVGPVRHPPPPLWDQALEQEKRLRGELRKKSFWDPDVRRLRGALQGTYEALLFGHYEFACSNEVEPNLWKAVFYKPIEEFRSRTRALEGLVKGAVGAGGAGGAVAVQLASPEEARAQLARTTGAYLRFLDDALAFYRKTVWKLQWVHGSVGAVVDLDAALQNEIQECVPRRPPGAPRAPEARQSVQRCLIYLGDLCRYQSMALKERPTSARPLWERAMSYYRQAARVLPASGNPYNQMAVMSYYTNDELRAVYYYFRSLAVTMPFVTARENLLLLFEKNRNRYGNIAAAHAAAALQGGHDGGDARAAAGHVADVSVRFVRLHGMLFDKINLDQFAEVLAAAMQDLETLLGHPGCRAMLQKAPEADQLLFHLAIMHIFSVHNVAAGAGGGAAGTGGGAAAAGAGAASDAGGAAAGASYAAAAKRAELLCHALAAAMRFAAAVTAVTASMAGDAAAGGGVGDVDTGFGAVSAACHVMLAWMVANPEVLSPKPASPAAAVGAVRPGFTVTGGGEPTVEVAAEVGARGAFLSAAARLASHLSDLTRRRAHDQDWQDPAVRHRSLPEDSELVGFGPLTAVVSVAATWPAASEAPGGAAVLAVRVARMLQALRHLDDALGPGLQRAAAAGGQTAANPPPQQQPSTSSSWQTQASAGAVPPAGSALAQELSRAVRVFRCAVAQATGAAQSSPSSQQQQQQQPGGGHGQHCPGGSHGPGGGSGSGGQPQRLPHGQLHQHTQQQNGTHHQQQQQQQQQQQHALPLMPQLHQRQQPHPQPGVANGVHLQQHPAPSAGRFSDGQRQQQYYHPPVSPFGPPPPPHATEGVGGGSVRNGVGPEAVAAAALPFTSPSLQQQPQQPLPSSPPPPPPPRMLHVAQTAPSGQDGAAAQGNNSRPRADLSAAAGAAASDGGAAAASGSGDGDAMRQGGKEADVAEDEIVYQPPRPGSALPRPASVGNGMQHLHRRSSSGGGGGSGLSGGFGGVVHSQDGRGLLSKQPSSSSAAPASLLASREASRDGSTMLLRSPSVLSTGELLNSAGALVPPPPLPHGLGLNLGLNLTCNVGGGGAGGGGRLSSSGLTSPGSAQGGTLPPSPQHQMLQQQPHPHPHPGLQPHPNFQPLPPQHQQLGWGDAYGSAGSAGGGGGGGGGSSGTGMAPAPSGMGQARPPSPAVGELPGAGTIGLLQHLLHGGGSGGAVPSSGRRVSAGAGMAAPGGSSSAGGAIAAAAAAAGGGAVGIRPGSSGSNAVRRPPSTAGMLAGSGGVGGPRPGSAAATTAAVAGQPCRPHPPQVLLLDHPSQPQHQLLPQGPDGAAAQLQPPSAATATFAGLPASVQERAHRVQGQQQQQQLFPKPRNPPNGPGLMLLTGPGQPQRPSAAAAAAGLGQGPGPGQGFAGPLALPAGAFPQQHFLPFGSGSGAGGSGGGGGAAAFAGLPVPGGAAAAAGASGSSARGQLGWPAGGIAGGASDGGGLDVSSYFAVAAGNYQAAALAEATAEATAVAMADDVLQAMDEDDGGTAGKSGGGAGVSGGFAMYGGVYGGGGGSGSVYGGGDDYMDTERFSPAVVAAAAGGGGAVPATREHSAGSDALFISATSGGMASGGTTATGMYAYRSSGSGSGMFFAVATATVAAAAGGGAAAAGPAPLNAAGRASGEGAPHAASSGMDSVPVLSNLEGFGSWGVVPASLPEHLAEYHQQFRRSGTAEMTTAGVPPPQPEPHNQRAEVAGGGGGGGGDSAGLFGEDLSCLSYLAAQLQRPGTGQGQQGAQTAHGAAGPQG